MRAVTRGLFRRAFEDLAVVGRAVDPPFARARAVFLVVDREPDALVLADTEELLVCFDRELLPDALARALARAALATARTNSSLRKDRQPVMRNRVANFPSSLTVFSRKTVGVYKGFDLRNARAHGALGAHSDRGIMASPP